MHVVVLSFTYIENDHRVLRAVKALAERGCHVTVISFGGKPAVAHDHILAPAFPARSGPRPMILLKLVPARLLPGSMLPLHFLFHYHRAAGASLLDLKPDCLTLPSAVGASRPSVRASSTTATRSPEKNMPTTSGGGWSRRAITFRSHSTPHRIA